MSLVAFFTLAFVWTWICWWSVVAGAHHVFTVPFASEFLGTLGQFGPFVAGIVVTATADGSQGLKIFLGRLSRWRAHLFWLAVALILLPATMTVAIFLYAWTYGKTDDLSLGGEWATLPWQFTYLLILGGPLGEEPGWRGFALPRLQEFYGPVRGSLILAGFYACWHLPLWWMYPAPCPFWMFAVSTFLLSLLFTWLFNHTGGSVFYCLLFHTSLSVASVRLPELPAYHLWLIVLAAVAGCVLSYDQKLGYILPSGTSSSSRER